ncbi:MAG: ATP-binding protein [Bacteroidota bacterium]
MQEITKTPDLLDKLQSFDNFKSIPEEALQWLIDHSTYYCYAEGDSLFYAGKEVNHMQVIVEGEYVIYLERDGKRREAGVWREGYITGVLPFSRMKKAGGYGVALRECCVLELHKKHFTEMVQVSYELVQNLVGVMSSRIREFSQLRFQDEKLMALGKLSAGLAHELNNPAAAMVRSASELYKRQHQTPDRFKKVMTMAITPEQTDDMNAVLFKRIEEKDDKELSLIKRQELEDELLDWLDDHEVENSDDLVEVFVDFRITIDDLELVKNTLNEDQQHTISSILKWFENTLSMENLVSEIQESADRISELVTSVKKYSHMDRATHREPLDVQDGIKNTLTMLKHKLKKQQIEIEKTCVINLPVVLAYGGQLNQVWTNIMDNAIDAMPDGGTLGVHIGEQRGMVCIQISDTGEGISEAHQTRIFEPFFTTKAMDEGTGMGLDIVKKIVNRHEGQIKVESEPGHTVFTVCLPAAKPTVK